jgi:transposase-like protein
VAQPAAGSRVYPVMFIDAHRGQGARRAGRQPADLRGIGVTVNGERDILGLWAGDGGEGAKFWLAVLTELKNRGVRTCASWSATGSRACRVDHTHVAVRAGAGLHPAPVRNTFRYASRRDWDELAKDLSRSTPPERGGRRLRFDEFADKWGRATRPSSTSGARPGRVHRLPRLRRGDRKIICSTNAIESLNARYRRAVRARRPLPDGPGRTQMPLPGHPRPRPHRRGRARWTMRWKPALNAFAITFAGRLTPSTTN